MQTVGTVLITGAASGIGRALAQWYAPRASRLLLLDLEPPYATSTELGGAPAEIEVAGADVRDAEALVAAVRGLAGDAPLDRVLHCAGVMEPIRKLIDVEPADVKRTIDVNLTGSFNLVHAVLPHLKEGSHVALVASLGGLIAGYRYPGYSSSKFGVVGLGETLRMELAQQGIQMQLICPGEVMTPMVESEIAYGDAVQRQVKLLSGQPITAERAAELIGPRVERGDFKIIVPGRARLLARLARLMPTRVRLAYTDMQVRSATRKAQRTGTG